MFLFTYGTLRKDEGNHFLLESHSKFIENCVTMDKYILCTQSSLSFPYMIPAFYWPEMESYATQITGDVFYVTKKGITLCDQLEGHPDCYERQKVNVIFQHQIVAIDCYVLTEASFQKLRKEDLVVIISGDWKKK